MVQIWEIDGVGRYEFPDDMSEADISAEIENIIIPNANMDSPDPEAVRDSPHLFPDIDRGSFFGGLGSGAERLGRVPEAVGAGVFRSQEELDDLKAQMAEENNQQRYRATLDDVTGQFDKGNYLQAAGTLFGDVLPQTLGESLPAMGATVAGSYAGAKLGALAGTAGGPLAPVTVPIGSLVGGLAGGVLAGLPNFFGMNVERQIEANEITDPDQIETVKATAAAAAQSGLEYLTLRAFNLIPGADKLGQTSVSKLVGDGVKKLGTKDGLKIASKAATRGGLTEAATEVGQQGLERLQAGLDVGNPEAIKEYIEAAVLGGLLGVGIGGTVSGGMDIRSTKKGIDETYRMLASRNMESRERQRQEAEDMAIYTGAIPDPDAPLQIEARPELVQNIVLSPVNGDPIESGTDEVQDFVNQSEAEFIDRNIERQINEAMDPEATGKTQAQRKTYQDLQVAKEALTGETYDLDALSETAPNIAQAVLQTEAGRGDYTVDKTEFTVEELEREGTVRGVDPEVAAQELQALRATRRPVTEMLANIRESDVIQAAQDKNIKTGTKSFDGLVKYITGANNLKEASPFRLNLMKEAMESIQAPFKSDQPIDLLDIREQNYEYNDFTEAVKKTLNNKNKSGKPVYNHSKLKVELPNLSNEGLVEIRDEMQRIGLIRKQGKKYIVDNELIRDEFVPSDQPIPDSQIVTSPDRKVNFEAEPLPDGRFRVVAREAEGDPSETGEMLPTDIPFERTISIHGTPQSAEASIEQYRNAPENSTDVDLRGIAVMPTAREYDQWQAELRQQKYNTDVVNNIKTSLKNEGERRGLQKAGISVEVVESLGAVGEGTIEGKYADGVITLALDAATVDADSSDVESARIDKIMKNLASVLSHEQIHALKEMGQISDSDYSLLVRQAAIKKRPNSILNTTNNPNWTYLDDAKASHAGVRNTKGEPLTQEELEEEAIAEMFRDWSNDPSTMTGKPASIFRRILKFITTLGGFLQAQNVRSVNDIFTDIQKGDFTQAEINKDAAGIQEDNPSFSIAPPSNIPNNTVKSYKLFRIDPTKPGELFPLFVDADTPVPQGVWVDATDGGPSFVGLNGRSYVPAKTGDYIQVSEQTARELYQQGLTTKPNVKGFKGVALRPGWHGGDLPVATHIGPEEKINGKKTKIRGEDEVWAEVEMPADVDWQTVADSNALLKADGTPNVKTAQIDQIPVGGNYRYKTNPNMLGSWMIAGSIKVNKVLSDAEAQAIRDESGVIDPKTGKIAEDPPRMGVPFDGKFSIAQPHSFTIEVKGEPKEVKFAKGLTAAVNRPANPMQRAFANGYMNIMSGQQKNKFASFGKGEYYRAGQEEARLAKPEATQVEIPGEIQRYAVDAIRPGKPTLTRYLNANSLQDAQAQVSRSMTAAGNLSGYLGKGASELTNLRLDDPATAIDPVDGNVYRDSTGEINDSKTDAIQQNDARRKSGKFSLVASGGESTPLRGIPTVEGATGPLPGLNNVARDYARSRGLKYTPQGEYVPIDPDRAARIAQAYDQMTDDINAPGVRGAYLDLIRQTTAQYDALLKAGYSFTFMDPKNDPYKGNPWNAMRDLHANKTMAIFPTDAGYGQDLSELDSKDNPLLAETPYYIPDENGNPTVMLANDVFRAVHDVFGHGMEGAGFRAQGEENAYQAHAKLFTGRALGALATETRGQNSWLNFGPYGEQNRNAKIGDTIFAEQKIGLMPEFAWREGLDPGKALPVDQNGDVYLTHFSEKGDLTETDPSFYGTGLPGDEAANKTKYPDYWLDRTYFGIDTGVEGGYVSEFPESTPEYRTKIAASELYDMDTDPDNLKSQAQAESIIQVTGQGETLYDQGKVRTVYEKLIKDAGYKGYYARAQQGMAAAVFEKMPVYRYSINRVKNKRYAVDAVRPNQSTVTRYFFAENDEDAQNVAASPSANQGASELTNLRLDDPDVAQDMEAPKFSIRRWRRVLDLDEYKDAVVPVPINPLRRNPNWGENTRGLAWLDNSEPLEVVLLRGIDIKGAGFGRDHILAKADRFGGRQIMGQKLRAMLDGSSNQNDPNYRIRPYKSKEPIFDAKGLVDTQDDYQMTWRDPEDGQIYVLGLEKYNFDGRRQAAITTFYPQDRKDGVNMGMLASDDDVAQYMAERDASRASYSIAYGVKPDGTHDAMISPRLPTTKQAQENALTDHLQVGLEAMRSGQNYKSKGAADKFTNHMNLLLDYPGFTSSSNNPDVIAQEFIDFAKSNLLFLYDQVEASTRDRSRQWYSGGRKLVTKIARKHNIPDQAVAAVMAGLSPQKDWYQNASLAERLIDIHMKFSSDNMAGFLPDNKMMTTARRIYKGKKYKEMRLGIMKKSYSELETPLEKAMWARTYDEAYNDRGFRKLTPEGEFIGEAEGKVAWGSNVEISKGTAALMDPSFENITNLMGGRNKIRSFYNNLLTPDAMEGDVTIDTHAVAAALLRALSGNSTPVSHNFASSPPKAKQPEGFVASKADNNTGAHGLYGLFADAYRAAAAERGVLPREMQSITWEAVRGLFTAKFKGQRKNVDAIDNIWRSYEAGELSLDDTRRLIITKAGDINDPTWLNPGSATDAEIRDTSYIGELDGDSIPRRSAGGVGTRSRPAGRTNEAGGLEVDRQGRIITPRYSIVKTAPPINSAAFAEYTKDVAPAFKNPDGSPKPLFTGTQYVFDEWAMNHTSGATFASETPEFAGYWASYYGDMPNEAAPDSIEVETATGQKVTIPQNEQFELSAFSEAEIEAGAEMTGTSFIIPLYSGAKKVWDYENPADIQAAREFLEKKPEFDPLLAGENFDNNGLEKKMQRLSRGDWDEVEDSNFVENFLKPNYDGFSIVENSTMDRSAKNPKNWGFFNKEDLKSVFNPDFDRTDAKFSIAPPKSFEEEVYERLTEKEVTGLKALVNKAKKLYKQQLLPGGLLPDEISELKIYRDNNFNIAEDTVARTLTSLNSSLKKAYGKRWYQRMTPEQNQEIDRFLHGDMNVKLPEPVKVAVMKMRQDIDNLSKDYVAILQNDIIQMTASGDPEAAARAKALQDIIIGNQGKYVTRSYKAFDDPYWSRNVPPDVVNNATRYIMAENGGDVDATETLMAVLLKGEKSAYGGMESLIKEGTLGARDLSILVKRKEIAPEIRALLGEYTDPKINYTRTMLKMSRLIWNTNFLKDVQRIGMREGWLTAEQTRDNTDAMAGTGSEVLAPLNGLFTTPEVKQAFRDALGKSSAPNWMNHLIGLNGVVKAGKVLYSPATQIRNFVSAPFFVIQSGSMNINEIQKAANTAWQFAVSKDGNTAEYFRELTRLGVTYNTPNVGMLQDALADGEQVFAALNQVGVNKFGETADQVVTAGKKVNNIIQNFYRIGDDFWKIVAYESQLAQYRKAKPNMPLEEVKKIVAKRVRDSIPTYSLIGSGMRKLGRFPVVGTFVAFSSEVIRTSVGNVKIMASDFADPDLRPLARKRAIGMAIAHSWTYAAGALGMSLLGITDDEEESVRKLGSPWSENANLLFWGRDEKGNMETVDLSFVDPYNLFHKPINALLRNQPIGDSLVGAAKEVILPFFGFEIATGALYEVITNRKMRTDRPIYNEDAPGLDQSEEIGLHLIRSLGPGVFRNIEGVNKAIKGQRSPSGKEYKLKDELLAAMGLKFSTFDPKLSLYFRSADFKDTIGNANSILYKVASNVNQVEEGDLEQAFDSANKARIRGYNDMLKMVNAARLSGVTDSELRKILSASRVSKSYINRLVRGKEAPKWRIGRTFLKGATKRARILLDRETARDLRQRRNVVRGIARDQQ